jgi:hypothetical protein
MNDITMLPVINSLRKSIESMGNLCTRAEIDDDMSTAVFLAHMVDELTEPTVKILAVLYTIGQERGDDSGKNLLNGYIQHVSETVAELNEAVDAAMPPEAATDSPARFRTDGKH